MKPVLKRITAGLLGVVFLLSPLFLSGFALDSVPEPDGSLTEAATEPPVEDTPQADFSSTEILPEAEPEESAPPAEESEPVPTEAAETEPVPHESESGITESEPFLEEAEPVPAEEEPVSEETEPAPAKTKPAFTETEPVPTDAEPVPSETEPAEPEEPEGIRFSLSGGAALQVSNLEPGCVASIVDGWDTAQVFEISLASPRRVKAASVSPQPASAVTVTARGLDYPDGTMLDVLHLLDSPTGISRALESGTLQTVFVDEAELWAYSAELSATAAFLESHGESLVEPVQYVCYVLLQDIPVYDGSISFTTDSFSRFIIGEDIKARQKSGDKQYDVELSNGHLFGMDDYHGQTVYVTPAAHDQIIHLCMTPHKSVWHATDDRINRWTFTAADPADAFALNPYDTTDYTCKCDCDVIIRGGAAPGSRCTVNVSYRNSILFWERENKSVTIIVADPRQPNPQLDGKTPFEVIWDSYATQYPLYIGITETPVTEPTRTTSQYAQGAEQNTTNRYLWWNGSLHTGFVSAGTAATVLSRELIFDGAIRQSNDGRSVWGLADPSAEALRPYIHDLEESALLAAYCQRKGWDPALYTLSPYVIKIQLGTSIGWYLLYQIRQRDMVTLSYDVNLPDGYQSSDFYNNNMLDPKTGPAPFSQTVSQIPAQSVSSVNGAETAHFLIWNTQPNRTGVDYTPGDPITISQDTHLYAIWSITNHILYDPNGGTLAPGTENPQSYAKGNPVTLAPAASRQDYRFAGWKVIAVPDGSTWPNQQVLDAGASVSYSGSVTLQAQWAPATAPLTIENRGMAPGEAALFRVSGNSVDLEVPVSGGSSVTIAGLPIGETVTVREVDAWSWRYDAVAPQQATIPEEGSTLTFVFRSPKAFPMWAEDTCRNLFAAPDE